MKTKKADISISLIFSIVIAIAGIAILFSIIFAKTSLTEKIYCSTIDNLRTGILNLDSRCEKEIQISQKEAEIFSNSITTFIGDKEEHTLEFNGAKTYLLKAEMPKGAKIKSASIKLIPDKNNFNISRFDNGQKNMTLYISSANDPKTIYLNLSKNIEVTQANIALENYNVPPLVDIYFFFDNSGSMKNEWAAMCEIFPELERRLGEEGINKSMNIIFSKLPSVEDYNINNCLNLSTKPNQIGAIVSYPNSQLTKLSVIPPNKVECAVSSTNPLKDDVGEAWALATAYLSKNILWRNNSKRMIFPISDSDPTGAQGSSCYLIHPNNEIEERAYFSGTEDYYVKLAINNSIQKDVKVYPVYGDEQEGFIGQEGFHVGCDALTGSLDCCYNEYNQTCAPILDWMDKLAKETGGERIGFKDRNKLQDFILEAIDIPYLSNLKVKVGSTTLTPIGSSELTDDNSPATIPLKTAINDYLKSCATDYCLVPIEITSGTEGSLTLNNLSIEFVPKIEKINLSAGNSNALFKENVIQQDEIDDIDLTAQIIDYYQNTCKNEECQIPIYLDINSSTFSSSFTLSNLSIEYDYSSLNDQLLNAIYDCWEQSGRGSAKNAFICSQVEPTSELIEPVTEKSITDLIITQARCHIIQNNDYACGNNDNIKIDDITSPRPITVEYKDKQVIVS